MMEYQYAFELYPGNLDHHLVGVLPEGRSRRYGRRARERLGRRRSGDRPLTSVAHEMFHQVFALHHASTACGGGSNGQVGVSWPPDQMGYLDGIGLNMSSAPFQFIADGLDNASPYCTSCGNQSHAYDFMSYCAPNANDPN